MADNVAIDPGSAPSVNIASDEVTIGGAAVQVQRIKAGWGADGAFNDPSVATPLPTQMITAPADPFGANADAIVAAGAAGSISAKLRRATQTLADIVGLLVKGQSNMAGSLPVTIASDQSRVPNAPNLYNGTTYDEERSNIEVTLLASAARTTSAVSAVQTNVNHRGVLFELEVTAKAGTTTLTLVLTKTSLSGQLIGIAVSPAVAVGVNQTYIFVCYPGAVAADYAANYQTFGINVKQINLPRSWTVAVQPSDSNSVTYSLRAYGML